VKIDIHKIKQLQSEPVKKFFTKCECGNLVEVTNMSVKSSLERVATIRCLKCNKEVNTAWREDINKIKKKKKDKGYVYEKAIKLYQWKIKNKVP
jgi:hypothetical protein